MQMDEELDEAGQFVLAVEGRIDVVPVSDIQSSTDVSYQQTTMAAVSTESALKSAGEPRRQRSNDRIKTAPSSVTTVKKSYSTPNNSNSKDLYSLPRKGAFSKEREETNKKAFELWLNKKLEEDTRKRSISQTSSTTESTDEKRKLNQKAFEAWLGKKKSQQTLNSTKIESRSSPAGCITVKSCGFEEWVRKKNEEKVKRLEYEALKKKELEESAAHVDPVLSKKAYSRWLKNKRLQAIKAKEANERCRKMFLKESKELTKSLKFQGF